MSTCKSLYKLTYSSCITSLLSPKLFVFFYSPTCSRWILRSPNNLLLHSHMDSLRQYPTFSLGGWQEKLGRIPRCRTVALSHTAPHLWGQYQEVVRNSVPVWKQLKWLQFMPQSSHIVETEFKGEWVRKTTGIIIRQLTWVCVSFCSYRTVVRPSYKVVYRTVTSLEWKCCPGFSGAACEEGKSGEKQGFHGFTDTLDSHRGLTL